jgi:hypothetical protein
MSIINFEPPDFHDLFDIAIKIGDLTEKKESLEAELRLAESKITEICTTDPHYFTNGKIPSMEYIKSRYHFPGLSGELAEKRLMLAKVKGELEKYELQFKIYQGLLEIYRTKSANVRGSFF